MKWLNRIGLLLIWPSIFANIYFTFEAKAELDSRKTIHSCFETVIRSMNDNSERQKIMKKVLGEAEPVDFLTDICKNNPKACKGEK